MLLTLSLPSEAACCLDSSAHRTFFLSILAVGENKHRTDSLEGVKHALYLFPPPQYYWVPRSELFRKSQRNAEGIDRGGEGGKAVKDCHAIHSILLYALCHRDRGNTKGKER